MISQASNQFRTNSVQSAEIQIILTQPLQNIISTFIPRQLKFCKINWAQPEHPKTTSHTMRLSWKKINYIEMIPDKPPIITWSAPKNRDWPFNFEMDPRVLNHLHFLYEFSAFPLGLLYLSDWQPENWSGSWWQKHPGLKTCWTHLSTYGHS